MTEIQDCTLVTMEVMGYQVHAIGKAKRPLYVDPVTCCDTPSVTLIKQSKYSSYVVMNKDFYVLQ